ncbi:MAG: universal stress protein [Sulfurovaceae bacterium]|nr:universal stress protein [Sulfurovaceae bacterium]
MQNHHAELFRKLHISSLLDLAFLVSARYKYTTFSRELVLGDILTAEKCEADLIVLDTLDRTGLSHLLMSSIAEKAIRHSTKPTFIVPPKP